MTAETRYPCPVCYGLKMEKVRIPLADAAPVPARSANAALVLDHCIRCGGVWFGPGGVQRLRREDASALWRRLVQREGVHTMSCHSCRAPLGRGDGACGVCGWEVELDCPTCARPLRAAVQDGTQLDYCAHCRGVWFDHAELADIWRLQVDAVVRRRGVGSVSRPADGPVVLLDVLLHDPFALYYGAHIAANVGGAAVEGLAHGAGSVEAPIRRCSSRRAWMRPRRASRPAAPAAAASSRGP